jgi:sugar/nucleoside kinase (ribokinase family)
MSARLDVLAMGEALWDLAAPRGRTFAEARSLTLSPGGAAVNVALALARLGWRAGLAAAVGADALGEALAARVAASGVSTALVRRAPARTGLAFVETAGAAPRVVGYRGDDEVIADLPATWRARLLVLTGVLPSETQAASFGAAARSARSMGALVVVDLNARPRMWRGRQGTPPPSWIAEADVVKASEEDLSTLKLGEAALRGAMHSTAVLIVTAGGRAARAIGPFGEAQRAPARVALRAAVGAGDLFTAGICDTLLRGGGLPPDRDGASWEKALGRGHALASRKVPPARLSG